LHALVLNGIDLTWQQRYREADSVFEVASREFPDHPAGFVYRAGVLQTDAVDHESIVDQTRLDSLLNLGKEKARSMIQVREESAWGEFFLGTAEGCDSYARVYRGDWMSGAMKGMNSFSAFKDAVRLDTSMYDADAGIGGFYYWRSRKTEHFNWIPFVGDDRPEGFTLLEKTARQGIYNRYTALSMLVAIHADAGNFDKAIAFAEEGLRRYPSNQVFLWGLTTALQRSGRVIEAIDAYERLLRSLTAEQGRNLYNELACRLNIARLRNSVGDTTNVNLYLTTILKHSVDNFPRHLRERVEGKLTEARDLLRKLNEASVSKD
jgi:tetratricopeptide (TPR) repeat protein